MRLFLIHGEKHIDLRQSRIYELFFIELIIINLFVWKYVYASNRNDNNNNILKNFV